MTYFQASAEPSEKVDNKSGKDVIVETVSTSTTSAAPPLSPSEFPVEAKAVVDAETADTVEAKEALGRASKSKVCGIWFMLSSFSLALSLCYGR